MLCHLSLLCIHHIFKAVKWHKIMQQWCMSSLFLIATVWIIFSCTKQGWFINWINNSIFQLGISTEASIVVLRRYHDFKYCPFNKYIIKFDSEHLIISFLYNSRGWSNGQNLPICILLKCKDTAIWLTTFSHSQADFIQNLTKLIVHNPTDFNNNKKVFHM